MASYKCKGSHVHQARIWVDEKLGAGTFDNLAISTGFMEGGPPNVNAWYDLDKLLSILQKTNVNIEAATSTIAYRNGQRDLPTIYRFFLRLASPSRFLGMLPMAWLTYVSFGAVEILQNEEGYCRGNMRDIPERFVDWACGATRGFIPAALERAGGISPVVSILDRKPMNSADLYRFEYEIKYRMK